MVICDICHAPGTGTLISAEQIREAVFKNGFNPFELGLCPMISETLGVEPYEYKFWRDNIVAQDTSDWNICPSCYAKLQPHIKGPPKPTGIMEANLPNPFKKKNAILSSKPAVTISDVTDIKALRLYCFDSTNRSDSEWIELYETLFAYMNPEFGDKFISRHTASGFTNIKKIGGISTEQAVLDIAIVLKTLVAPKVQAFVQVCEFARPNAPSTKSAVWLVSFISNARSMLQAHQTQVVLFNEPIGFLSGAAKPKKSWKFWK